ncbi:hypothetical protein DERP_000035 [Dermatophagoides pteronyssinus]|uniref:Uncharacterized protein n=1 Tax=Dermatophagoides pteronyssinus TaxID=6956 RepID=A0ABQ8IZ14_DERPT|nr:hypothetical protein DERP_000035 [Dermatophagoides pteronyssinus]
MSHSFRLSRRLGALENYNNKRQVSEHCRYAALNCNNCNYLIQFNSIDVDDNNEENSCIP